MRTTTAMSWLLCLASMLTPIVARQPPTSYCKCICFQNSTIIPLNSPPEKRPPHTEPEDSADPRAIHVLRSFSFADPSTQIPSYQLAPREAEENPDETHHRTLTCSDCNRAFCLDYNLPICKGAKEEDVFTSCFQRDSVKDETVILLFILLTASLLSWAVVKPWIDRFRDSDSVAKYVPVTLRGDVAGNRGLRGGLLPRTEGSYGNGRAGARSRGDSGSIARQGGLNS